MDNWSGLNVTVWREYIQFSGLQCKAIGLGGVVL